ncbi:MAG: signal peptidase II [Candidatus Omnitrophica bacterium]|nr:signal peptidase II [Candidatus Omnitrophota bacterium]
MIQIIVISVLFLDQLTKFLVVKNLALGSSIPIINGIFHLSLVHNKGAAFGILKNQVPFLIATSLFTIILFYFALKDNKHKIFYCVSLSLVLAGALGNLIDRVRVGYVIDFLDFRIWPVFNIADSAITIGAVMLGWSILTEKEK